MRPTGNEKSSENAEIKITSQAENKEQKESHSQKHTQKSICAEITDNSEFIEENISKIQTSQGNIENMDISGITDLSLPKGCIISGLPRTCKRLSFLYKDKIYYAVDRSIISINISENTQNSKETVEYITTAESKISSMYINNDIISIGTISGEIILMKDNGNIIYKKFINEFIYNIVHTDNNVYVSLLYKIVKIDYTQDIKHTDNYEIIKEMNDISMFFSVIPAENREILAFSNSNTLFTNSITLKYSQNIVFMYTHTQPNGNINVIIGLTNRKVYFYSYSNEKLSLTQIIHVQDVLCDIIVFSYNIYIIVMSNTINIYYCMNTAECIGMVGPYDDEILKVFLDKDRISQEIANETDTNVIVNQVINQLYIVLSTGGVFKYTSNNNLLRLPVRISSSNNILDNSEYSEVYKNINRNILAMHEILQKILPLCNAPSNIISGNLSGISHLSIKNNYLVTANGPTVRVFFISRNGNIEEIFRPVIDGFPVNSVITDWAIMENGKIISEDFSLITNSNNIIKVYKPTELFQIRKRHCESAEKLLLKYNEILREYDLNSEGSIQRNSLNELLVETESFLEYIKNIYNENDKNKNNLPFTAIKQELSLTTLPHTPEKDDIQTVFENIKTDLGLSTNHFLEVDKIYGFPFEISTFIKYSKDLVLLGCKSSQRAFSNLFVLNSNLETVQKVFTHTKTITMILSQDNVIATLGKDRKIAIYRVKQGKANFSPEDTEESFRENDFGVEFLSSRIDHKKEILAAEMHDTEIITSSKDKTVNTYSIQNEGLNLIKTDKVTVPATAIHVLMINSHKYTMLGNNNGYIFINGNTKKLHNSRITNIRSYTSEDGQQFIITASEEGIIRTTKLSDLQ
ncbi:hypothetical protein NEPAR04_2248 [Nematocida parisii]|nr:hypothetical protein NEPAR08_2427 [Nematocida parisii]KAI5144830.1 hypothetical protein NEPAR04_2248 [Nematocida parisii]